MICDIADSFFYSYNLYGMIIQHENGELFRILGGNGEELPSFVRSNGIVFWKDVLSLAKQTNAKMAKQAKKRLLEIRNRRLKSDYRYQSVDHLFNSGHYPFTFQAVGINRMINRQTMILAEDVGMGKTIEFGAFLAHCIKTQQINKAVILTRTSVKYQIRDELYRFFVPTSIPKGSIQCLEGNARTRRKRWLQDYLIMIASYGQLRNDYAFLKEAQKRNKWNAEAWILDEASQIKNPSTKIARRVKSLSKSSKFRIAATATPIENGLEDLYSIAEFVQPGIFVSKSHFRKHYCRYIKIRTKSGRRFEILDKHRPYKNLKQAKKRLKGYYLRRTIKDISIVLPPVVASLVSLRPNKLQKKLYKQVKRKYNTIEAVVRSRQLCNSPYLLDKNLPTDSPKTTEILELINGELANKQVIIATQYRSYLDLLSKTIKEPHGIISGKVKSLQRELVRRRFQSGELRIMLMTDAGNYGLNLQAGSVLINADCPWNPAKLKQRIGRIYRIDTKHDRLQVINLVIQGTIEEKIIRRLKEKEQVFTAIFEKDGIEKIGDPIKGMSERELKELL